MDIPEGPLPNGDPKLTRAVAEMLGAEIARGEMPSASWRIVRRGEVVSAGALGHAVIEPERIEASEATIYDLASLTKPLITTTLVLRSVADGLISPDEQVRRFLPELADSDFLSEVTWADLLAHRAGLEAWFPLYVEGRDRAAYLAAAAARPAEYAPRSSVVYSDLGFVLAFIALERLWSLEFSDLVRAKITGPLGLDRCGFTPSDEERKRIAATERGNEQERRMVGGRGLSFSDWREGVLWGEVNDGNAFYLGGVSGHAGLFGDARSVALLASVYLPGSDLLPDFLRRLATTCQAETDRDRRGLGWQLRMASNPAAPLSGSTFGHTGFTGTSVWVDPEAEVVVVLLTNRIHPLVKESRIQEIRRRLNEIVAAAYL